MNTKRHTKGYLFMQKVYEMGTFLPKFGIRKGKGSEYGQSIPVQNVLESPPGHIRLSTNQRDFSMASLGSWFYILEFGSHLTSFLCSIQVQTMEKSLRFISHYKDQNFSVQSEIHFHGAGQEDPTTIVGKVTCCLQ